MGHFRELTVDELDLVAGGDDGQVITVVGSRLYRYFNAMNATFMYGMSGYDDPGSSSQPVPPQCTCGLGDDPAAHLDALADQESAEVLREILAKANQNMEYGSIIYLDANGNITHTPLQASATFMTQLDLSAIPKNADGTTDFSRILGMVHSHPQWLPNENGSPGLTNYFTSADPDRLLYPSDRDDRQDDWDYYSWMVDHIAADGGDASNFSMYIAGFDGTTLKLNQYFGNDAHTNTSASGDPVDQNYVSPTSSCELHG